MALKSLQTHVSDGTLQSVQFSIAFLNTSHLHFYVDDVEITVSTSSQGVAVDGVDEYGVTLTAAVPSGAVFKVQRQTPRDNVPHVFSTGAALFTALTTDANNEYLLYVVQETYEQSGQGPFPEITELVGTEYVVVETGGARKQITVQNFLASVASTTSLILDLANNTDTAKGAGMLGTQYGTTVQERLARVYYFKDAGVIGDGTTDNFANIITKIKEVGAAGGGLIIFPSGVVRTSKAIPFVNNVRYAGCGIDSTVVKAADTSKFGVFGEAYPSKFCELNGWIENARFNQQYDSGIAALQNSDGSVSGAGIFNLTIDNNKSVVPFNDFDAGAQDDAYQCAIRCDAVNNSVFKHLKIKNVVYTALSNYSNSDHNLWEDIEILDSGKVGKASYASANNIYLEASNKHTIFNRVIGRNPLVYGALAKAGGGGGQVGCKFIDCQFYDSPLEGIRIGDDAATDGVLTSTMVIRPRLENCGTESGYAALRVAHSGTGSVNKTVIDKPVIIGGGVVAGLLVQAGAVDTEVISPTVIGVTGTSLQLSGGVNTNVIGNTALWGSSQLVTDASTINGETIKTALALSGSWVSSYGAGYAQPAYYRLWDEVHLIGTVKSGSGTISLLPAGFRPEASQRFTVMTQTGYTLLQVDPDGTLWVVSGSTTDVSLNSVSFKIG